MIQDLYFTNFTSYFLHMLVVFVGEEKKLIIGLICFLFFRVGGETTRDPSTTAQSVNQRPDIKPQIAGEAQKLKTINRSSSAGPVDVKPNISQISKSKSQRSYLMET